MLLLQYRLVIHQKKNKKKNMYLIENNIRRIKKI